MRDARVDRWLAALLATPGLTAIADPADARRVHVEEALAALPLVGDGPLADVGSGGGSPGIPIAAARPDLRVDLVESSERKCAFLRAQAHEFPNVSVVCVRAEDWGRGAGRDAYATVLARALAPPPVAAEWCLPLVHPGGRLVVFAGEADERRADAVARRLGARLAGVVAAEEAERRRLLVFEKLAPTPEAFPRRPGVARKRPLA